MTKLRNLMSLERIKL